MLPMLLPGTIEHENGRFPLIKGGKGPWALGVVSLASGRAGLRDNPFGLPSSFPLYLGAILEGVFVKRDP